MNDTVHRAELTPEEHRLRHVDLHQVLLVALQLLGRDQPTAETALDLLPWSASPERDWLRPALDEVAADMMACTGLVLSRITLLELKEWSREQTLSPEQPYGERYRCEVTRVFRECREAHFAHRAREESHDGQ